METVKLNIVPKGVVKTAHASQGDAARVVRFELFDEFLPYTLDGSEDITLTVVRPDTEEIVSSVTNTEEAYIDVSFTSEMTALRGVANCEIRITKSGAVLGSHNFDLNIERGVYGEDITVETAQGVIATFTTGVIDNLVGLKTTFEPKQDLHGYPSPWPAGAGKNKLFLTTPEGTYTKSGVIYKVNSDGTIETSGTATADDYLLLWNRNDNDGNKLLVDGNYILNGCASGGTGNTYYIATNGFGGVSDTGSGDNFTIDSSLPQTNILISVKNGTNMDGKVFKPMIRLSSVSDPAYEPYENICEIEGIDEINLFHTGVNLFNKGTIVSGYIDDADGVLKSTTGTVYKSSDYISVKGGESYYIKTDQNGALWGAWYDINKNYISGVTSYKNTVKTAPDNAAYMRLTVVGVQAQGGDADTFGVNYPATDINYHAYDGESALVEIGQEVYGGYYDKNLGIVLTKKKVYLNSLVWSVNAPSDNYWFLASPLENSVDVLNTDTNVRIKSEILSGVSAYERATVNSISIISNSRAFITVLKSDFNTVESFVSWLTNVNAYAVYELETPIIIPADAVNFEAVKGVNNVWSDTNGETEVKFFVKES